MPNDDYYEKDYEPTQEEWEEIEELILQEEFEELKEEPINKVKEIHMFSMWCKENGIIW